MLIKKIIVGQLRSNCYLAIDTKRSVAIVIDPGDDADYIQKVIADEEVEVSKIVTTHGHFDHILAVYELQHAYDIPFLLHKSDEFLLSRMQSSAEYFAKTKVGPPPKVDKYLNRKTEISVGKYSFKVIEAPGHTPGSVCLYCMKEKVAFVGDLVFEGGLVGRTDYKYSNYTKLERSIKKIMTLPKDTVLHPGHGNKATISELRTYFE
jgi:glyoxylase-like metal-dependent hydrolase (beta-lactamase superfamily II)